MVYNDSLAMDLPSRKVHFTHVLGPNKASSNATFGRSEHALTVTAESAVSTLGFAVSNFEGI